MVDCRRLGPALHRGRGTDRRGEDEPGAAPRRAPGRAARPRGGGGQPVPRALLPGPERLGVPDPALLPPEPLAAAAEAAPDRPLRRGDGERLRLRQGPHLRHPDAPARRSWRSTTGSTTRSGRGCRSRTWSSSSSAGWRCCSSASSAGAASTSGTSTPIIWRSLARAYNDFFFHYTDTPLLVINTSDIDFVHNAADLDNLVSVVRKMRKGVHHYLPLSARK